jgi:3-oxoacyl-[acyl-carrier protein] reductase
VADRKRVLVAGAAGGIGAAICRTFAGDGWDVVTADVRSGDLVTDLSDPEQVTRMVDAAWPVSALVNAAGIYPATPLLDMTAQQWDRVQDINVRAPVLATVAFARRCVEAGRGGCVVNITSGAALRARPGAAHYCSSKAALEMATRACALELAPQIRVNAVSPGYVVVDSDVNPVTPEYHQAVSANPMGRPGTPDDIAQAVLWLAGDHASWVTGSIVRVDGGSSTGAPLPVHWPEPTGIQKGAPA